MRSSVVTAVWGDRNTPQKTVEKQWRYSVNQFPRVRKPAIDRALNKNRGLLQAISGRKAPF
jgi:hypothetical protein